MMSYPIGQWSFCGSGNNIIQNWDGYPDVVIVNPGFKVWFFENCYFNSNSQSGALNTFAPASEATQTPAGIVSNWGTKPVRVFLFNWQVFPAGIQNLYNTDPTTYRIQIVGNVKANNTVSSIVVEKL